MKSHTANIRQSTVTLVFFVAALHFIGGCTNQMSARAPNEFKIEFGRIVKVDGANQLADRTTTIRWTQGVSEPRIGAYIESVSKKRYSLAYTIFRISDDRNRLEELERDGWWTIGPPANNDYEAFIYSSKIKYTPGHYLFSVLIDGKEAKRFEFTIVDGSTTGEK